VKLLLLADHLVGLEIVRFLHDYYPKDLALVVTVEENEIYRALQADEIPVQVFESCEALAARLAGTKIDLGILAWWPKIIKTPLLELPRLGFINTHPSLLPHSRGKHYNFWTIIERAPFGVTLHCVDSGVDSGDIVAQQRISYDWCDNGGTLYRKAQEAMVELFRNSYPSIREEQFFQRAQDPDQATFHKASELEMASHIDLDARYSGRDMLNLLRARTFPGHPACWFDENGKRYEVRVDIRRIEE
jgi:methionyl-tRNA formyltransferase